MKSYAKAVLKPVLQPLRHHWSQLLDDRISKQTGLLPIDQTKPEDVFICGYPKSGNTWFQYIASALVYGADPELAPDTLINDLVPDVHHRHYYRRYGSPCVFKSHALPLPAYRRIVYLMRDGRDAMVSYFHFLSVMSGNIDFYDMVKTGRGLVCKWHEHVETFQANPHGAEMIVIRYEDLKVDTVGQLRRFCDFMRIDRTDATLRQVADATSFGKMRLKEQRTGWELTTWPKDKPFTRRGAVGSFKDEMPAPVLEAFMQDAGRTLISQGYDVPNAENDRADR